MKILLSEIKNTQPQRDHGNIEELKLSIKQLGLLEPIGITKDYELVYGRRRVQAFKELGEKEIPAVFVNPTNPYEKFSMALHENTKRKNLNDFEEAKAEQIEKELYEKEFPETKQYIAGAIAKHKSASDKMSLAPSYVEIKAKLQGVSERTIERNLQLAKALKEYPDLEKFKTKQSALRELKLRKQKEKIKTLKPVEGLFDVIVIDPPWETISKQEYEYHPKGRRCVPPYPTMSIEQIRAIKIPASENCILWFWTINSRLHEALHIVKDWGFEIKNILTWGKDKVGLGEWLRGQTEHCILAIKGKPLFDGKDASTLLLGKRTTHSSKPEEFHQLVEKTCFGRKLDYFARKERDGWSVFGDEL